MNRLNWKRLCRLQNRLSECGYFSPPPASFLPESKQSTRHYSVRGPIASLPCHWLCPKQLVHHCFQQLQVSRRRAERIPLRSSSALLSCWLATVVRSEAFRSP